MDVMRAFRQARTLIVVTVRYLLGTRRVIPTALLASAPVVIALAFAVARIPTYDILVFQSLMVPLFLQVVLIFVTLVNATTLVREEIEDNTLPYLMTRPISKPAIAVYKYVGYLVAVLVLLVPPVVLAYAVTEGHSGDPMTADLDVLGALLLTTVLGSVAYGALFLFLSVLVRKPLAVGLLIGFVWESVVSSFPGDVPKISIIHYLKSIIKDLVAVGPLTNYTSDISTGIAVAVLVGFSIAMLVLALFQFQQMEFRQKA